jgi:hypothetical protein
MHSVLQETTVYEDETLPQIFSETIFWKLYLFMQYHVTEEFKFTENIQNYSDIHCNTPLRGTHYNLPPVFFFPILAFIRGVMSPLTGYRGLHRSHK